MFRRGRRNDHHEFVITSHQTCNDNYEPIAQALLVDDLAVGLPDRIFLDDLELLRRPPGDTSPIWFCKIFSVLRDNDLDARNALSAYLAMTALTNDAFMEQAEQVLVAEGTNVIYVDFQAWIVANELVFSQDDVDIWSVTMRPQHYVLCYCLTSLLMGKYLDNNNYTQWFLSRKRSFMSPLGITKRDDYMSYYRILVETCQNLYDGIKIYWKLRRLCFMNLFSLARRDGLLKVGAQISINLLRCAEMTNWNFISHWIVRLHPDLLMWNEIGKYLPALSAAYSKYVAMGPMADWGKLIYPPSMLTEFANRDLSIPFAVAREISSFYGNTGVKNIKSDISNNAVQELIDHAMLIVSTCGGARTIDTMALRAWRYGRYSNIRLNMLQDSTMGSQQEDEVADIDRANVGNVV